MKIEIKILDDKNVYFFLYQNVYEIFQSLLFVIVSSKNFIINGHIKCIIIIEIGMMYMMITRGIKKVIHPRV